MASGLITYIAAALRAAEGSANEMDYADVLLGVNTGSVSVGKVVRQYYLLLGAIMLMGPSQPNFPER